MFDFIFAVLAIAAVGGTDTAPVAEGISQPDGATLFAQVAAEPQTPTGKFTTAGEVKPILTATKANWIAVREYGGNDLLYVTHLWAWRCGLGGMAVSVNGGPFEQMQLPACHTEYATPNAVLEGDGLPYIPFPSGHITQVVVQLIYDDLSRDSASFERAQVLIP